MNQVTGTLVRIGWRSFSGTVAPYAVGSAAYVFVLLWLYPSVAHAPGIQSLLRTLPKGLVSATGLSAGLAHPLPYLASEFYGTLYLWILMMVTVLSGARLLAEGPTRGAAGPYLAGPLTRRQWFLSQGAVVLSGLWLIAVVVSVAVPAGMAVFEPRTSLSLARLLAINGMAFLLTATLAGIMALAAAGFADDQQALSVGGAVIGAEYVLSVVSGLAPHLSWLRYLSLFSLYRPTALVTHGPLPVRAVLALCGLTLVSWGIASELFRRRDLNL